MHLHPIKLHDYPLCTQTGRIFYSSNPLKCYWEILKQEKLFLKTYMISSKIITRMFIKSLYMKNGEMIGIYKVTLLRTKWMEQVNNKASYVVAVGIVNISSGLFIRLAVLYFLNRRLNMPVKDA